MPEQHLEAVIKMIRRGLEASPEVDRDVREALTEWCESEEDYMRDSRFMEGE